MQLRKKSHILLFALVIVLVSRLSYYVISLLWNLLTMENASLSSLLFQWDAEWYAGIIEQGYHQQPVAHAKGDAANWAFFPLYPLLVSGLMTLFPLNASEMGPLVSSFLHILLIYYAVQYVQVTRQDDTTAMMAGLLLGFGPYTFYLSSLYTEALYMLLVVLSLWHLHREKWLSAGFAGALLSLSRPTGVFMFIPALIRVYRAHLSNPGRRRQFVASLVKDERKLFCLLFIPAGLFAYMTYLYRLVGDPLAFMRVQLAWGRVNSNPLSTLYHGFTQYPGSAYLAAWGLLGLLGAGYLLWQKRYEEGSFGLISILIPLSSGLMAVPRYFMGSFVLLLALNDLLSQFPAKFRWAAFAALSLLNVFLLLLWFSGHYLVI